MLLKELPYPYNQQSRPVEGQKVSVKLHITNIKKHIVQFVFDALSQKDVFLMSDDISFCPKGKCRRKSCMRNQSNIRDRTIPHSFFVEIPPDCPKINGKDNNHGIYHVREKKL